MEFIEDIRKGFNKSLYLFGLDRPRDDLEYLEYVQLDLWHKYTINTETLLLCGNVVQFKRFLSKIDKMDNNKLVSHIDEASVRKLSEWLVDDGLFIYEDSVESTYEIIDLVSNLIEYTADLNIHRKGEYQDSRFYHLKLICEIAMTVIRLLDFVTVNSHHKDKESYMERLNMLNERRDAYILSLEEKENVNK